MAYNQIDGCFFQETQRKPKDITMISIESLIFAVFAVFTTLIEICSCEIYLNKFAVHIPTYYHNRFDVSRFASNLGFVNHGQIGELQGYYLFEHPRLMKRSLRKAHHLHKHKFSHPRISWYKQQKILTRVKRDFSHSVKKDGAYKRKVRFIDPLWPEQWYLNKGGFGGYDMNVKEAWRRGYTGRGVVVTILDDGIEHNHTDIHANYDAEASLDINGADRDPLPRYDEFDKNRHGTRCAGEVAALPNNTVCIVGIAFEAKVGGVRMLDGEVSDYVEATALSLRPQHVDVYSASWGPDDSGKIVDGPDVLARQAFVNGILKGRGGLGSIYVWASGNGGAQDDSCSCDGYTNSIFTLSISSVSERGLRPWYLESCASTLATTYSSGENFRDRKIVSTDIRGRCTESHTGTSASAPIAAAIIALTLQANRWLSWRDMQYITLLAANPAPLLDADWSINGCCRKVSHNYGYGLMDAGAMVLLAEKWKPVSKQLICSSPVHTYNLALDGRINQVRVETDGCRGHPFALSHLEHVQVKVSLQYSRRGDLQLHLVSPVGTRSTVLPRRSNDRASGRFSAWPFMSVHFWGERPSGLWNLQIENTGDLENHGILLDVQLILYGINEPSRNLSNCKNNDKHDNHIPIDKNPLNIADERGDCSEGFLLSKDGICVQCLPFCRECKLNPSSSASNHQKHNFFKLATKKKLNPSLKCVKCFTEKMILHNGDCLEKCPAGSFQDRLADGAVTCRPCSKLCVSCNSYNSCLSCESNAVIVNDLCQLECSERFYKSVKQDVTSSNHSNRHFNLRVLPLLPQAQTHICLPCSASCKTCSGPSPEQCLTCAHHYRQHQESGLCVKCCEHLFHRIDQSHESDCCSCSPYTEQPVCSSVYIANLKTSYLPTKMSFPARVTEHDSDKSALDNALQNNSNASKHNSDTSNHEADDRSEAGWRKVTWFVVFAAGGALLAFLVVFGILQAHARRRSGWRGEYQPVPLNTHSTFTTSQQEEQLTE